MFTWVFYSGHLTKATTSLPESINWPTLKVPPIPPFKSHFSFIHIYITPGGYSPSYISKKNSLYYRLQTAFISKWILKIILFFHPITNRAVTSPKQCSQINTNMALNTYPILNYNIN